MFKNKLGRLVFLSLVSVVCLTSASAMGSLKYPPLETVDSLDLNRYMGKWYEVASIPQWFQLFCKDATAQYSLRSDGKVDVINTCRSTIFKNKIRKVNGTARVVNPNEPAKLKVKFWAGEGDYWVIDLADDYSYAVVGDPKRRSLWVLSRTPELDERIYDEILERARNQYYDISRIKKNH